MSYTSSNDLSLDTFQNNKKKTDIILYLFAGLLLLAVGLVGAQSGGIGLIFGLAGVIGGSVVIYQKSYKELVDPKNERRCDLTNVSRYKNVKIPDGYLNGDTDVDTLIDSYETDILMKLIYENYGGVYLQSNVTGQGGTYDAWFIPGGTKSALTTVPVPTIPSEDASKYANRLYVINKGDRKVTVRDINSAVDPTTNKKLAITAVTSPVPFVSDCDPGANQDN